MDDGEEIYFSLHYSRYYMEQETVIERLTRKLKLIWCVLMNREYSFYEVTLDEKDVPKLKKMVKSL